MLLETMHLTKDYGAFRALDDVNLHIAPGEVFGLLGPNGSGKSTALRLLMGFLRPTLGRAAIDGHDCWSDSVAVRRKTAYLPGELRLYENMSGWQLLRFLAGLRGETLGPEADRLARRFDIDLARPIANLSSGMKRKLALMQVLLPSVPLLILDEPTNTLDPTMRDELLDQLVAAKQRGQAVLFSSHVLQEAERVCDRVGILSKGQLVHVQRMSELQASRLARVRFRSTNSPPDLSTDSPPHDSTNSPPYDSTNPPPYDSTNSPPYDSTNSPPYEGGVGGVAGVAALPGVRVLSHHDGELALECTGELQPLLQWLAAQPVVDLRIEPLGLSPIYNRYHAGTT